MPKSAKPHAYHARQARSAMSSPWKLLYPALLGTIAQEAISEGFHALLAPTVAPRLHPQ